MVNMIKYLGERGITPENVEENVFDLFMEIHPEWAELYKRIARLIPADRCEEALQDVGIYREAHCRGVLSARSEFYLLSESLRTDVYNSQDVVSSFSEAYGRGCRFVFVLGRSLMTEKGHNAMLDDFIMPNLGRSVELRLYDIFRDGCAEDGPEFKAEIIDDSTVIIARPHYDFETIFKRYRMQSPEIAAEIKEFYRRRSFAMDDPEVIGNVLRREESAEHGGMGWINNLMEELTRQPPQI